MLTPVRTLSIALLAYVGGVALAQPQPAQQSARDPIRITSLNNGQFQFVQGQQRRVYDLSRSISGCTSTLYDGSTGDKLSGAVAARVLDQVHQAGFWYVLMQVDTNTGCNIQGMCGAGTSTDVIWLKFSSRLTVQARQAVKVEDCADDTSLTQFTGKRTNATLALELRGGVLALVSETEDYTAKTVTVTKLRYDRRQAARGLNVSRGQRPSTP